MRKAIISIVVAFACLFASIPCATAVNAEVQSAECELVGILGLIPEEVISAVDDDLITRGEFAYSIAKLSGTYSSNTVEMDLFADVAADHKYASAINHLKGLGVVSGGTDGYFRPDDAIKSGEAMKMMVNVIGYERLAEEKGGYPTGYNSVAAQLGLYDKINASSDSYISKLSLETILSNAMEVKMPMFDGIGDNSVNYSIGSNNPTVLEKMLGVTVYRGKIVSTDYVDYSAGILIERSENYDDPSGFEIGRIADVSVGTDIDMGLYKNVPAEFYIKDGTVIYITPQGDIEIFYKTVYSVNGDTTEGRGYNTALLSKMTFLDDETKYDVSSDLQVFYNGEGYSGNLPLTGTLVRAAVVDNEVFLIETWNFKAGGIINKIEYTDIQYQRGASKGVLRNYNQYVNRQIIIDGRGAVADDLKVGAVFHYYADDDYENLVIAVSEICIAGDLNGITDTGIQVGQILLNTTDNLYAFESLSDGSTVSELSDLLRRPVKAYMNPFGKVAYLCTTDSEEISNSKNFVGYLTKSWDDPFGEVSMSIIALGSTIEDRVLKVSEKVNIKDDYGILNLTTIRNSAGDKNGWALYKFRLNAKDEISTIERMNPYYGFEGSEYSGAPGVPQTGLSFCEPPSFVASSIPEMPVNGKTLYFDEDTPIYILREIDGKQTISTENWSTLSGLYCDKDLVTNDPDNVKMNFYGQPMQSEVDMILIAGDVDRIRMDSTSLRYKVIAKITDIMDEDGEVKAQIDVGDDKFVVSKDLVSGITAPAYIRYRETLSSSKEAVSINEKYSLTGGLDTWADAGGETTLHRGTVEKFDGKRLYLTDGTVLFMNPRQKTYYQYTSRGKIELGYEEEIMPGDYILYFVYDNNDIPIIVYEK